MNRNFLSFIFILLFFCTSCTQALWKATDPDAYIKIKYTDITEEELKNQKIKYYKDDRAKYYYVNKSSFDKLKNYAFRAIGTPVTIIVDATALLIIGIGIGIVGNVIDSHRTYQNPYP